VFWPAFAKLLHRSAQTADMLNLARQRLLGCAADGQSLLFLHPPASTTLCPLLSNSVRKIRQRRATIKGTDRTEVCPCSPPPHRAAGLYMYVCYNCRVRIAVAAPRRGQHGKPVPSYRIVPPRKVSRPTICW